MTRGSPSLIDKMLGTNSKHDSDARTRVGVTHCVCVFPSLEFGFVFDVNHWTCAVIRMVVYLATTSDRSL